MTSTSTSLVPVASGSDTNLVEQLGELVSALVISENKALVEGQQTSSKLENLLSGMEKVFKALTEQNQALVKRVVESESYQREREVLFQQNLAALGEKVEVAQKEASDTRQQMVELTKKVDAFMVGEIATRKKVVEDITIAAEARIQEMKHTFETSVKALEGRVQDVQQLRPEVQLVREEIEKLETKTAMDSALQAASVATTAKITATANACDDKIAALSTKVGAVEGRVAAEEHNSGVLKRALINHRHNHTSDYAYVLTENLSWT